MQAKGKLMLARAMMLATVVLVGVALAQAPDQEFERDFLQREQAAFLGVRLADVPDGGVRVGQATPGGPAAKAGLKRGDVITMVDGVPVMNAGQVVGLVWKQKPGDEVKVTFRRGDGEAQTVKVKLGERGVAHMRRDRVLDLQAQVRALQENPQMAEWLVQHNRHHIEAARREAQEAQDGLDPETIERFRRHAEKVAELIAERAFDRAQDAPSITLRTADGLTVQKWERASVVVRDAKGKELFKGAIPKDEAFDKLPENVRAALNASRRLRLNVPPDVVVVDPKVTFAMPDGLTVEKVTQPVYLVKFGDKVLHDGPMPPEAEKAKLPVNVQKALDTAQNVRTITPLFPMPRIRVGPGIQDIERFIEPGMRRPEKEDGDRDHPEEQRHEGDGDEDGEHHGDRERDEDREHHDEREG
jgi:membrane-associated protease RseP (regulator of RpoE activity)